MKTPSQTYKAAQAEFEVRWNMPGVWGGWRPFKIPTDIKKAGSYDFPDKERIESHNHNTTVTLLQRLLERDKERLPEGCGMGYKERHSTCDEDCNTCAWNTGAFTGYNTAIQEDIDFLEKELAEIKKFVSRIGDKV